MANELVMSLHLRATLSSGQVLEITKSYTTIDVAGARGLDTVQSVGTSEEAIQLGDLAATGGYVYLENLDATNFIGVRQGTGATDLIKLLAGDWCVFRIHGSSTAPFAIADTAACNLRIVLLPL